MANWAWLAAAIPAAAASTVRRVMPASYPNRVGYDTGYMRQNFSTNTRWEPIVGYSRAVRVDNQIFVTGTTSTNESGEIVGKGDPYAQAMQVLRNIESVLKRAGAEMRHVVRTRMFVTDISQWQEIGRAHSEFFRDIRPAATMVEVSRLIDPDLLVEIEVDAVIAD